MRWNKNIAPVTSTFQPTLQETCFPPKLVQNLNGAEALASRHGRDSESLDWIWPGRDAATCEHGQENSLLSMMLCLVFAC